MRELEAESLSEYHVGLLLLSLSSSLRKVSVSFRSTSPGSVTFPDVLGSFLEDVVLTAERLETLSLSADHALERGHLLYIQRLTSLVEIGLSDFFVLDEIVLQMLSTMPTLQVLTGGVLRLGTSESLRFKDGFRALDNLAIKGTYTDLCKVLTALTEFKLHSLTLKFTNSDGQFAAVLAHLPNTLTQYASTFCAPLDPATMSIMDLVQPLMSKLPNLNDFGFFADKSPLSVTNDDLVHLGDAWPHLTHLRIEQSPTDSNLQDARRPNISGLIELARRCPKLKTISLPELDASRPAEPRATPFLGHRLKHLFFQSASVVPALALNEAAVAINMIFPHLELHEMRPRPNLPVGVNAQWAHIWGTLEIMRWGRRDYILYENGCDSAVPEVSEMP